VVLAAGEAASTAAASVAAGVADAAVSKRPAPPAPRRIDILSTKRDDL
jgi:hypothetical protein